jgi:hypothetical protein
MSPKRDDFIAFSQLEGIGSIQLNLHAIQTEFHANNQLK